MINVNITNIVAESLAICAIATCGVDDEAPPPSMRTIDDIFAEHGFIQPDHAPYIDERAAELADYKRNLADKDEELGEMADEVERLKDEIKALKAKQKEVERANVRRDKRNNSDSRSASGSSDSSDIHTKAISEGKTYEATFYTAFCPTGCTGVTATGVDVSNTIYHKGKRIIAVDPSVIPLGSHVRVTLKDGTSFEATAQDTGGDIRGNRIDILVASRDEAYRLGRQTVNVEILN